MSGKRLRRAFVAILLAILIFAAFDVRMAVRRYVIDAEEITSNVRIALVTDLHSCRYGTGQNALIKAVDDLAPDLVLLGGDIFDDDLPDESAELFLAGIADRYPCYYVTGNHEYLSGADRFSVKMSILRNCGVTILSGECVTVRVNGENINICGVDDPEAFAQAPDEQEGFLEQLRRVNSASDNGCYTVLLSHRPEYFDTYVHCGFDMVLCGHAHGGQWRLPPILNGLFAPNQGLFPKYAGGQYTQSDTIMIVSRGLARESTRIPRIFNRPELLLIELE
ncbi:MAG: metallophosphoesterase [Candidatus Faecivicinus sp.]